MPPYLQETSPGEMSGTRDDVDLVMRAACEGSGSVYNCLRSTRIFAELSSIGTLGVDPWPTDELEWANVYPSQSGDLQFQPTDDSVPYYYTGTITANQLSLYQSNSEPVYFERGEFEVDFYVDTDGYGGSFDIRDLQGPKATWTGSVDFDGMYDATIELQVGSETRTWAYDLSNGELVEQ